MNVPNVLPSPADVDAPLSAPRPGTTEAPSEARARDRFRACLLGGAVGDALGAPVEFMSRSEILTRFGTFGITDFAPAYGGTGLITDDTQMTLYTAEGLIRGWLAAGPVGPSAVDLSAAMARAYLRWLLTQGERSMADLAFDEGSGWLSAQAALQGRRGPGITCLGALRRMSRIGEPARNDSKGCGGVMRIAPVGLFGWRLREHVDTGDVFALGAGLAGLTHGHPTGALASGALAVMVMTLLEGAGLPDAVDAARSRLCAHRGHEETLKALDEAVKLARAGAPPALAIRHLGEGWIAEEALAISVFCAWVARDFRDGVTLAVNHDGDSDSTGAVTGNLLGAQLGTGVIPHEWLAALELREVISTVADDLYDFPDARRSAHSEAGRPSLRERYPAG